MSSTSATFLVGATYPNDGVINPDSLFLEIKGSGMVLLVKMVNNASARLTHWILSNLEQLVVTFLEAISMTLPENAEHPFQKKDCIEFTEKNFKELEH
jgi:hypothetical protein